ncbi:MAG: hypothetical protein ACOYXR_04005 [Nitrospirota bacterium]
MKHLFYAFYVSFYAGAMFVAGLFVGQFMERRWAVKEREQTDQTESRTAGTGLILDKSPVALSNQSTPSR